MSGRLIGRLDRSGDTRVKVSGELSMTGRVT